MIFKNFLFLFCFITGCLSKSNAQELTLSGTYTGELSQGFQSKALVFNMILNIQQKGQSFTGTVKNVSNDGKNYYVVYNIEGSIEDNVIEWNDVSVAEERSGSEINWCKQKVSGKITINGDSIVLSGNWKNDGRMLFQKKILLLDAGGCYPGSFRVSKKNDSPSLSSPKNNSSIVPKIQPKKTSDSTFLNRKVNITEKYEVVSDSIKLFFYDNGIIDNDTISVYYNNVLILNHQRLSYTPVTATIPITKNGINELQMFANNEGEIPPNTALLVFTDNRIRREIVMKSDLKTTAALSFIKINRVTNFREGKRSPF